MDLHFWNTDRLAAGDADSRRRFVRIIGFGARNSPDIIGLSEVKNTAFKSLERFADDHSYRLIHRRPDGIESHAVLMISHSHRVHAKNTFMWIDSKDESLDGEVVVAAIEDPTGVIMTVASVYIHAPLPTVLGRVSFIDGASSGWR
ncbi:MULTISPECIES: endonuclease/exonuclease/phosphatase family protein [Brevibacterium]|uniref:Endonuclease/Exonuclease/phosphatase family protein n=2 Tax=Brevibacterium TaxID=1696 RepID=A0A1H1Q065_BRESA|nr:endonuclease/exonuclease/phosphatase family protein [Brevibacterium sandarakinum]SDS16776.1 Endonuclease/Exonuclease/phosphatase family protein [Brevibacterium sandarakinum]